MPVPRGLLVHNSWDDTLVDYTLEEEDAVGVAAVVVDTHHTAPPPVVEVVILQQLLLVATEFQEAAVATLYGMEVVVEAVEGWQLAVVGATRGEQPQQLPA